MKINNQKAIDFVTKLREIFPCINFYCPAEHEDWIQRAFNAKIITVDNILNIDCEIVADSHILLVYTFDHYLSNGMMIEINEAQYHGIPILIADTIIEATFVLDCELERMRIG